jgi:hypothetical protein
VNCTCGVLFKDLITLLPPSPAEAEILETFEPGDRVSAACKRLKAAGYLIALDDFAANDPRIPLVGFADIIKVDFRARRPEERAGMMRRFGSASGKARNIPGVSSGHDMGFACFRGYFFCRPEVVMGRKVLAAAALCPPARNGFTSRNRPARTREDAQNRKHHFLPFVALSEFSAFRICPRKQIDSPCHRGFEKNGKCGVGYGSSSPWAQPSRNAANRYEWVCRAPDFANCCPSACMPTADLFLMGLLSIIGAILEVAMVVLLVAGTALAQEITGGV